MTYSVSKRLTIIGQCLKSEPWLSYLNKKRRMQDLLVFSFPLNRLRSYLTPWITVGERFASDRSRTGVNAIVGGNHQEICFSTFHCTPWLLLRICLSHFVNYTLLTFIYVSWYNRWCGHSDTDSQLIETFIIYVYRLYWLYCISDLYFLHLKFFFINRLLKNLIKI